MTLSTRSLAIALCLASLLLPLSANDAVNAFKDKVEARYKNQKLKIVPPHIVVGLFDPLAHTDTDFHVHYDHFYPGVEMPKRYLKRENLDDHTTEEVTGAAQSIDQMAAGETLEVMRISIFRRSHDFYVVDLMLRALSGKRLATETSVTESGPWTKKIPYGVHFRFAFPPTLVDYDAVVHEINQYLLPVDEYKQLVAAAEKAREGPKKIDIQPGMSKEDVVKALGEPLKTIDFGKKTILKYQDITVELQDDKVTDVKTN